MANVAAPTTTGERITNLDTVRGVATLGILVMNSVSFALPLSAYYNLDAGGTLSKLDRAVGVAGDVLVDQKAMALFSLLFGVGIVVFAERAEAHGRHPIRLSLWRDLLLLGIGLLHLQLWGGDVLVLYSVCAPIVLVLRNRSPRLLIALGGVLVAMDALVLTLVQLSIDDPVAELGEYWFPVDIEMSGMVKATMHADLALRALGMMLIGVGLLRLDVVQGHRPAEIYRRMARVGLTIGMPLAVLGVALQATDDGTGDLALVGAVPNTLATIPMALAYLGIITLWNQRPDTWAHRRIRAVGRMALTNYLTQTLIGLFVFNHLVTFGASGRTQILGFVVVVWTIQLAWSKPWLARYNFGPVEWVWRTATYGRCQPFRRSADT